jgi:hypothetical protein
MVVDGDCDADGDDDDNEDEGDVGGRNGVSFIFKV